MYGDGTGFTVRGMGVWCRDWVYGEGDGCMVTGLGLR